MSVWEEGCCNDLVNASYRVTNIDTGESDGWIAMCIVDDAASFTYYFSEECNHSIEVYGEDCLGNSNSKIMYFHVDESEPGLDIQVGDINCYKEESYCVKFSTPINLSVWEEGCCNDLVNASYRVTNIDSGESDGWIAMDIVGEAAFETYYFDEECNHTIELYGEDCLGNANMIMMLFHVDEQEPTIDIIIDDPICEPDDDFDYCITSETAITIEVTEQGCCDELVNASYRIGDDEGWGPWIPMNMVNHEAAAGFNIPDECNHTIQIQTWDCLMNMNTTTIKLHVDNSAPGVDISVGDPNCDVVGPAQRITTLVVDDGNGVPQQIVAYCVNLSTVINLTAWEQGCCNQLVNVSFRVDVPEQDGAWISIPIDEESQTATFEYKFEEECHHRIVLYAEDCLGNKNQTTVYFNVDESKPTIDVRFNDPICVPDDEYDLCITSSSLITIEIEEQGCCDQLINASYRIGNDEGWGPWIPISHDGHLAVTEFYIYEECNHTIEIKTWDCLMNENSTTIKVHVDDSAPGINLSTGDPHCESDDGYDCVTMAIPIYLDVWERGCCNQLVNASYKVTNIDTGVTTGWIPMEIINNAAYFEYYFIDECNHTISVYGEDCLGNSNMATNNYHVDETEPIVDITVGQMNCVPDDGFDYCIRTDTPIDIIIKDKGCCENLFNASYRIGNDEGWGPWVDLLPLLDDREIEKRIYIYEECNHTLEVQAWDCLENKNTTSMSFHVDDSPPMITKTVGQPNIPIMGDDIVRQEFIDYWVNCTSLITIDAEEQGCCDELVNVSYRINDGPWISIIDVLPYSLDFDESCTHTLDIVAKDCLGNTMYHNETFKVDCEPPISEKTFFGSTYPEDLNDNGVIDNEDEEFYWLQDHETHIILRASENYCDEITCDVGIDYLYVELWWDQNENGTIDADEIVWARTVLDNDENDDNECVGYIEYNFTINDDCLHEIRWYAVDKLGNKELTHVQQHRVDSQGPETIKTIGEPKWWDEDLGLWWVTSETNFNLKSVDLKAPCDVGLHRMYFTLEYNCDNESEYENMVSLVILDNDSNDLNPEEGIIEYNFTLPMEGWWKITWQGVDKLGNVEELHVQYHIVDDTPPHVIILKPTNGWYAPGSVIPSVVLSEDIPSPHSPCGIFGDAVGIEQGQQGKAWLIDVFPEFNIIELDTTNFLYDQASHEYIGNIQIPFDVEIDGAALFVAGSEDRLGNNWTSMHELIHAMIIDALADCATECCVIEFLADELSDFIADRNIVFVGIDSTPPEVNFDEETSPIPEVLYPGIQMITADIFDALSGIDSGTPCYVTLNGASLGTLPYDPYLQGCSGGIIIPYIPIDLTDAELTISVYDHAGNKGSDTIIVDYVNQVSEKIPTVIILDPEDNTEHTGTLTIEIQASDAETATEDLSVFVRLMHEEDPSMKYYATYNSTTDTFFVEIDISKYTDGSILDIQAFATDEEGYTGDSDFRLYRVLSNIIFDQWFGPGWNLVNIVELCGDGEQDLEEVLASLGDAYDVVFEVGSWDNWRLGRTTQTLTTIQEGEWYWINITVWEGVRFYLEDCTPPVNNPPVANPDSYDLYLEGDLVVSAVDGVLKNDNDPDGDPITAVLVSDVMYGTLTFNADGSFTYELPEDSYEFYEDSFTYKAKDDKGAESAVVTVYMSCEDCVIPS